jgi:DNA-binding transcriptional ArsR family regulator
MSRRSREPVVSSTISEREAELFRALSHPARIRALEVLSGGERSVAELAGLVGLEASHLSQQVGLLRRAGLVTSRKEGSSVFYALIDPTVTELLSTAKRVLISMLTESTELLAGFQVAGSASRTARRRA